jgi:uncharacterized protein (TIGR03032 family)
MAQTTAANPVQVESACLEWLDREAHTLCVTTYLAAKVIFIGARSATQATVATANSPRCMGAAATPDGRTFWISSQHQMWRLERCALRPAAPFDSEYVARAAYTVGDIDGHDVALPPDELSLPVFAAARYSCLARPGSQACFEAVWKPPFITKIAAEDRCHLNGIAVREGRPAYVTAVAETDFVGGWREHRSGGGVVMEVPSGEVVCRGLSMPHSPRWHEGNLYVINSGAGEFGRVDLANGKFEPMAFLPGYGRGMVFSGNRAIVGLSDCRENRTFQGLPLDEGLQKHGLKPRCGIFSVDLATGETEELVVLREPLREIYDVFLLPGTRCTRVLPLDQGLWHEDRTADWKP